MSFYNYKVGTIQVTNGSTAVVGTSTLWGSGAVVDGDLLQVLGAGTDNILYEIQVNSDTSITLDRNYGGSNGSGLTYVIYRQSVTRDSYSAVSQQVSDFVATYRALITVTGANRYFTLDKTASTDDAGLWFKTAGVSKFRAGLFGDNNYHLQWLDSSTWTNSLVVDAATGVPTFGNATYSARFTGGNVGIGTASPGSLLHLYSSQNALVQMLRIDNPDANGKGTKISLMQGVSEFGNITSQFVSGVWQLDLGTGSGGTPQTITLKAGNVGIGTASPGTKLEVAGVIKTTDATASTSTTTGALVVAGGVGVGGALNVGKSILSNAAFSTDAAFSSSNTFYTITSGSTLNCPDVSSGFLIATYTGTGSTAIIVMGGGFVNVVAQSTGSVWAATSTPSASQIGIYWDAASRYVIKNGFAGSVDIYLMFLRTRPAG